MRRHRGCINLGIKLGLLAGLSASSIAMAADAPSVHVYNWYDYIGPTPSTISSATAVSSRSTTPSTVPKSSKAN